MAKTIDTAGFDCIHCKQWVSITQQSGTKHRNHCTMCLWSKHVDVKKGDRDSDCFGAMQPIGLTLKHEGFSHSGELMLIHLCNTCDKISINRIAGDDDTQKILNVFNKSQNQTKNFKERLHTQDIVLLTEDNRKEIEIQLFGK